jgi:hypothetical protein
VILELASALFAGGCVWASARRLAWAVAPTSLDPRLLVQALGTRRGELARSTLRAALDAGGATGWERDLLDATAEPDEGRSSALLNEQLSEFEERAGRWGGVPRVCARLATSGGFLFATIALLQGLAAPADDALADGLHAALMSALGSLAVGIAGTSFCVAIHFRARKARTERAAAVDALVQRLGG